MSKSITPADTAAHLRRLAAAEQAAADARAQRLRASLPAVARCLRETYGAERVVLFGSLATNEHHIGSDLDVAAVGIPRSRYFAALADLMGLVNGPVDLLRLEDAPESLAERIAVEGIEL